MQNFIKTIINSVRNWVKGEIKKSKADWNQNDSSADNYVKNRPFYETEPVVTEMLPREGLEFYEGPQITCRLPNPLEIGGNYIVIWNDVEYNCVCKSTSDGEAYIGNGNLIDSSIPSTGEPFAHTDIAAYSSNGGLFYSQIYYKKSFVKQLDKKYLPDDMAVQADIEELQNNISNVQSVADNALNIANDNKVKLLTTFHADMTMPSLTITSTSWNDIAYGNGKFVAIASKVASVTYSEDGIIWKTARMSDVNNWNSIAYGNGAFVVVGNGVSSIPTTNVAAYSEDGINWRQVS